jgi:hypothetical protein
VITITPQWSPASVSDYPTNFFREEFEGRLYSGDICYYSPQILSVSPSRMQKVRNPVVNMFTTWFNTLKLCILPAEYIYVLCTVPTIKRDFFFPKQH